MPPSTKISKLPEDIQLWLEDELANNDCRGYSSITAELNKRLAESCYNGTISREAVRRFGVKVAAKIDLRDTLLEHIKQELDPDRTIPPVDWHRAVVSAIGFLNYRTLTDLQCQETISVKEHAAFMRGLLTSHKYEKLLGVEPLKYEEVREFGPMVSAPPPAAVFSAPPPQPSPLEGEGVNVFASPSRGEAACAASGGGADKAPAQPVEGVPLEMPTEEAERVQLEAPARIDTEKHETIPHETKPDGDSGPFPPPESLPKIPYDEIADIPLPGTPERAANTVLPADVVLQWPGVPKNVRRKVLRYSTQLKERPQEELLSRKLSWALEEAGYYQDVYVRQLARSKRGREKAMAMDRQRYGG